MSAAPLESESPSNIQFLVQPFPETTEGFQQRLQHVSLSYLTENYPVLDALKRECIKSVVVGSGHFAFLLGDGRVCRVAYNLLPDTGSPAHHVKADQPAGSRASHPDGVEEGGAKVSRASTLAASEARHQRSRTLSLGSSSDRLVEQRLRFLQQLSSEVRGGGLGSDSGSTPGGATGGGSAAGTAAGSGSSSAAAGLSVNVRTLREAFRLLPPSRRLAMSRAQSQNVEVPDELVAQAQVVLQGKSRQAIIRELQKTNLDVNLALNNLLSREGDEPEDEEAGDVGEDILTFMDQSGRSFQIPTEDLSTLIHDAESSSGAGGGGAGGGAAGGVPAGTLAGMTDDENMLRPRYNSFMSEMGVRLRRRYGSSRSFSTQPSSPPPRSGTLPPRSAVEKKGLLDTDTAEEPMTNAAIQLGNLLVWWSDMDDNGAIRHFTHISGLHSELIAVDTDGRLCQWRWDRALPFHPEDPYNDVRHPRAEELGLISERISQLKARNTRCTLITESNKVTTFLDHALSPVGAQLEHHGLPFNEITNSKLVSLEVNELLTIARTTDGRVFWWGLMANDDQLKMLNKKRESTKQKQSKESGASSQIEIGSRVSMRTSPLFNPGAKAICLDAGRPLVGVLMESAYLVSDECRFKLIEPAPQPEMPVSKPPAVARGKKRSHSESEVNFSHVASSGNTSVRLTDSSVADSRKSGGDSSEKSVVWCLQDVVFVDDVQSMAPIGRVVQIDGAFAAVLFEEDLACTPSAEAHTLGMLSLDAYKKQKLVRLEDLQLAPEASMGSGRPSLVQTCPKEVRLPADSTCLSCAVVQTGLQMLTRRSSGQCCSVTYSLAANRICHTIRVCPTMSAYLTAPLHRMDLAASTPSDWLSAGNMQALQQSLKPPPAHPVSMVTASTQSEFAAIVDHTGCLLPTQIDSNEHWVWETDPYDLPALQCIASSLHKPPKGSTTAVAMVAMVFEDNPVLRAVQKCDADALTEYLDKVAHNKAEMLPLFLRHLGQVFDGNRNVLHLLVSHCQARPTRVLSQRLKLCTQQINRLKASALRAQAKAALLGVPQTMSRAASEKASSPRPKLSSPSDSTADWAAASTSSALGPNPAASRSLPSQRTGPPFFPVSASSSSAAAAAASAVSGLFNQLSTTVPAVDSGATRPLSHGPPPSTGLSSATGGPASIQDPFASGLLSHIFGRGADEELLPSDFPPPMRTASSGDNTIPLSSLPIASLRRRERDEDDDAQSSFSLSTTAATAGHSPASSLALSELSGPAGTLASGIGASLDESNVAGEQVVGAEESTASQRVVHLRNISDSFWDDVAKGRDATKLSSFAAVASAASPAATSAGYAAGHKSQSRSPKKSFLTCSEPQMRGKALHCIHVLSNHPLVRPYLCQLLSHQNAMGNTPFQDAVTCRAYDAAFALFKLALCLSSKNDAILAGRFVQKLDSDSKMLQLQEPLGALDDVTSVIKVTPPRSCDLHREYVYSEPTTVQDVANEVLAAVDNVEMDWKPGPAAAAAIAAGANAAAVAGAAAVAAALGLDEDEDDEDEDDDVDIGSAGLDYTDSVSPAESSDSDSGSDLGDEEHIARQLFAASLFLADPDAAGHDLMSINQSLPIDADRAVAASGSAAADAGGDGVAEAAVHRSPAAGAASLPSSLSFSAQSSSQSGAASAVASAGAGTGSSQTPLLAKESPADKASTGDQPESSAASKSSPLSGSSSTRKAPKTPDLHSPALFLRTDLNQDLLNKFLCPNGSSPQDNPLFVLAQNGQCTYGFSGSTHISQNIFNCNTCGLTDNMCCCSTCAVVCHGRHAHKFKRTSESAYCDCSLSASSGKCRAIVAGDQTYRLGLFRALLIYTHLAARTDSHGQSLLLLLVRMVIQQMAEQKGRLTADGHRIVQQKKTELMTSLLTNSLDMGKMIPWLNVWNFPDVALGLCLTDWTSLSAAIMDGTQQPRLRFNEPVVSDIVQLLSAKQTEKFATSQSGSQHLDSLMCSVLARATSPILNAFQLPVQTLFLAYLNEQTRAAAEKAVRRFVRSLLRVTVAQRLETVLHENSQKKKSTSSTVTCRSHSDDLDKWNFLFKMFNVLVMEETLAMALSLIRPVMLGHVTDSSPLAMPSQDSSSATASSSTSSSTPADQSLLQALLSAAPVIPRKQPTEVTSSARSGMDPMPPASFSDGTLPDSDDSDADDDDGAAEELAALRASKRRERTPSSRSEAPLTPMASSPASPGLSFDSDPLDLMRMQSGASDDGFSSVPESDEEDSDPMLNSSDDESAEDSAMDITAPRYRSRTGRPPPHPSSRPALVRGAAGGTGVSAAAAASLSTPRGGNAINPSMGWVIDSTALPPPSTTLSESQLRRQRRHRHSSTLSGYMRGSGTSNPDVPAAAEAAANTPSVEAVLLASSRQGAASLLARAFSVCIHRLFLCMDYNDFPAAAKGSDAQDPYKHVPFYGGEQRLAALRQVREKLQDVWDWLMMRLDKLEADLRRGAVLTMCKPPSYELPCARNLSTKSQGTGAKGLSTLKFVLDTMRSSSGEGGDSLPCIRAHSLPHLVFMLEAMVYTVDYGPEIQEHRNTRVDSMKEYFEAHPVIHALPIPPLPADPARESKFFKRPPSLTVTGAEMPSALAALSESISLAERPHLLEPAQRQDVLVGGPGCHLSDWVQPPGSLAKSQSIGMFGPPRDLFQASQNMAYPPPSHAVTCGSANTRDERFEDRPVPEEVAGRWRFFLEKMGPIFAKDLAGSALNAAVEACMPFHARESTFRREMEQMMHECSRECNVVVTREPPQLLVDAFVAINEAVASSADMNDVPCRQHLKVQFKNEPAEGSGVVRNLFTAVAEALSSCSDLPFYTVRTCAENDDLLGDIPMLEIRQEYIVPLPCKRVTELEAAALCQDGQTADEIWWTSMGPASPANSMESDDSLPVQQPKRSTLCVRLVERLAAHHCTVQAVNTLVDFAPPWVLIKCLQDQEVFHKHANKVLEYIRSNPKVHDFIDMEDGVEVCALYRAGNLVSLDDCELKSLFYSPCNNGFYTPRPGPTTRLRDNAFANVGRLIGLALLHGELFPLPLCRHVLKYLMEQQIVWHDLAFFDPELYESLRKLMVLARSPKAEEEFAELGLTFRAPVREEEGGDEVDLFEDGALIPVTPRVADLYVERLAHWHLVESASRALQCMLLGLEEVLEHGCLKDKQITPEDFRLLLNSSSRVDLAILEAHTVFHNESGEKLSSERAAEVEKWFWSILRKMSTSLQQELLYFWTSSPALQVGEHGFTPQPSVVIRPADQNRLPTANTCISRLYIPLYKSKKVMRQRLLTAIKTKGFGFV